MRLHHSQSLVHCAFGTADSVLLRSVSHLLRCLLQSKEKAVSVCSGLWLVLSLFGAGFSAFAGTGYVQAKLPEQGPFAVPLLSDLPWFGPALFRHHPLVYGALALGLLANW